VRDCSAVAVFFLDGDGDGVVQRYGRSELGGVGSEGLGTFRGVALGEANAGLGIAGKDGEGVAVNHADYASREGLGEKREAQQKEEEKGQGSAYFGVHWWWVSFVGDVGGSLSEKVKVRLGSLETRKRVLV
jgi:hypothetical protein